METDVGLGLDLCFPFSLLSAIICVCCLGHTRGILNENVVLSLDEAKFNISIDCIDVAAILSLLQ